MEIIPHRSYCDNIFLTFEHLPPGILSQIYTLAVISELFRKNKKISHDESTITYYKFKLAH
jgi:hypothetical protein